jgi:hypothetical protein
MTQEGRKELYDRTMQMLKPALERVASDPEFRARLELNPLAALAEMHVELDAGTRRDLEGRRFSEFWAIRRKAVEGPVESRDLPPEDGALDDQQLDAVAGGLRADAVAPDRKVDSAASASLRHIERFAPPYVPV